MGSKMKMTTKTLTYFVMVQFAFITPAAISFTFLYLNGMRQARLISMSRMSYIGNLSDTPPAVITKSSERGASKAPKTLEQQHTSEKLEFTGAGTLGDIMSDEVGTGESGALRTGLVTQDGGTLAEKYGIECRLDRMALTANGNLQRLFSSYYDAPVHVVVDRCDQKTHKLWDRLVHLTVHDQVFCSANSEVTIHDSKCQYVVESGKVGLGQLFRYLDRLPTFELQDAGYNENGALWRIYDLKCEEVSCRIREDFHPSAWEIRQHK